MRLLEVCVEDIDGLNAAVQGGADRIELCSNLDEGGVTASAGVMAEASNISTPVIALIRPRGGGFLYSEAEVRVMLRDIETSAKFGLAGIAIGALTRENRLDLPLLKRLIQGSAGLQLTLHRAFDLVGDQSIALEEAITLGFHRVLTSGGASNALMGAGRIGALVQQSHGRIQVLAGSGITARNVSELLALSAVQEVHASCRELGQVVPQELLNLGFAKSPSLRTSARAVQELRRCILGAV